jgi:hypothetical protein
MEIEVALWDAINRYAISVGGDPSSHVYGNTSRMQAVADVGAVVARVASRQQIDDLVIDDLVKGSNGAAAAACAATAELKKLKADHAHLQRLYMESRDYVRTLEGERDDLVAAAQIHVMTQDRSDAEVSKLRACLTAVRDFLRDATLRPEEAELIAQALGEEAP